MKIQLASIEKEGVIHLGVDGKITSEDFTDSNANPIDSVIGAGWAANRVLMDLSRVNYIDSSGIGWLLRLQKGFREGGGAVALYGITPTVMQMFSLLKLGGVFKIAETEAAARDLLTAAVK